MYRSIPSLTIPRATLGDSHILVAPGVGFSLLCLACGGLPQEVLDQRKSSIILKKARFSQLSLKQMGSSSFHLLYIYIYMLEVSSVTWAPFTL